MIGTLTYGVFDYKNIINNTNPCGNSPHYETVDKKIHLQRKEGNFNRGIFGDSHAIPPNN